jgi:hypothetical protein
MSDDKWFVDAEGKIVAGLIRHQGKLTPVGDYDYLPYPYGKGLGRLEKKIRDLEVDAEGPTLEDAFPNLKDASH